MRKQCSYFFSQLLERFPSRLLVLAHETAPRVVNLILHLALLDT